ncbi:MAG: DegT/DnrJ/EryC1/StrS family aminotransferase, partial [Chloroflexi bacterium]|nr:DegT/DnrJ/EryC1/StrS family aminotransferase [Chloroflexota bacterium]
DALQAFLTEQDIGTLIYYPTPPHLSEAYRDLGYSKGAFPITERLAETNLALPMSPCLIESELDIIIKAMHRFDWAGAHV